VRALLDANVYLSYLITSPTRRTPPALVVEAALSGEYTLLLTAGVIRELRDKSESKPYLAARIPEAAASEFIGELGFIAEIVPELDPPLPEVGRDRKDDYLFAHAVVGQADYLVSGDSGVRAIDRIGAMRIVTPAEFLSILGEADKMPPPHNGLR
jgi:putative PIN family toxin of toxin-antitoxin system